MSSWVDQAKRYVHAHDVATAAASATDAAPPPPPDWLLAAARLRSHRIREPTGGDLVRSSAVPASHCAQKAEPCTEVPVVHAKHSTLPDVLVNLPAAQSLQSSAETAPSELPLLPGGHSLHPSIEFAPVAPEKVPRGHFVH